MFRKVEYNGVTYPQYEINENGVLRRTETKEIRKLQVSYKGYLVSRLSLGSEKLQKSISIHRAVICTFTDNIDFSLQVNHKDGDKTNNNLNNLEWCTCKENIQHANKNHLIKRNFGSEHHNSKLTEKDVLYIKKNYVFGDVNYGAKALGKKFKVDQTTISLIIKNKTWKHVKNQ